MGATRVWTLAFTDLGLGAVLYTPVGPARGLVAALHGGGFDHRYFHLPGHSLVERMTQAGLAVLAIDRPGYGASPRLPGRDPLSRAIDPISTLIARVARDRGFGNRVVVLGHSIGGAVAVSIAAASPPWLAGVTVSGVGETPRLAISLLARLLPPDKTLKPGRPGQQRLAFFGPRGSFDPAVPPAVARICVPAQSAEIVEVLRRWPARLPALAAQVRTPVQLALADGDPLWRSDSRALEGFAGRFSSAAVETVRLVGGGHLYDVHHAGPDLHARQIGFALACARQ